MSRNQPFVIGLGEILWDLFPTGPRFGGAPANFACAVAGLTAGAADVAMASAVGNDDFGRQAQQTLAQHGVATELVQTAIQPTGSVTVEIDDDKKATYEFASDVAWDHVAFSEPYQQAAERADAICFGSLGQRGAESRDAIRQFLAASRSDCLRIFDVNLRRPFLSPDVIRESLRLANVLKLNDEELPYIANLVEIDGEPVECLTQLATRFELQCVAYTRGSNGAVLISDNEVSELSAVKIDVVDTVGAGDSFTAALTVGLLQQRPLAEINQHASRLAAYVCSQPGATPTIPAPLQMTIA
ncbi:MAG: carbohydrate kinase [bacterium]|nr:carbohydrate kinase [bacterium]